MPTQSHLVISAVGGLALLLGGAYGWSAREYRDAEVVALTDRIAQLEQSNAHWAETAEEIRVLRQANADLVAALEARPEAQDETGRAEPEAVSAGPASEAVVSSQAIGNPKDGETVFKKCRSCHQVGQGAEDRVGPHLNGIFGRRAGAHDGFKYSQDMTMMGNDGLTWTLETLDVYLENPKSLVSRTRMNFSGLKADKDRADVLAYLRLFSDNPANIPEAHPTALPREVELPPDILAIVGDPEYGEYLASECQTCHQSDGDDDGIPAITHWPEEDFVVAMHAYKRKIRPHPVMQMMAGRLSDEEIAALAAYFGSLD